MSAGNQAWGEALSATSTDAGSVRRLGERRLQLTSDAELRNLTAGDIADPGERTWLFVEHDATEAAWAQGNSVVLDDTAVGAYHGELTDAASPSATSVLGLAQFAWAATVRRWGYVGRSGPFEALSDGTIDAYEAVTATNNIAAGRVAGVAFGASTDAHIGIALEAAIDGALATVVLDLE